MCTQQCGSKGECPSDKPIWSNGECIAEKTCPGNQSPCEGGQVWKSCASACNKTCDDPNPMCTEQCVSKCECPSDKPIWRVNASLRKLVQVIKVNAKVGRFG